MVEKDFKNNKKLKLIFLRNCTKTVYSMHCKYVDITWVKTISINEHTSYTYNNWQVYINIIIMFSWSTVVFRYWT